MTTYNGEQYISSQLQSILDQTRKSDEVVICDDRSSDSTVKIIEDFLNTNRLDNWILIRNDRNIGYKQNFHKAISLTTGDIIFLSDQDDVWYPDKIRIMTNLFEENNKIRVLNTSFTKIDHCEKPIATKRRLFHSNHNLIVGVIKPHALKCFGFDYIIWRNISPGCTMAFDKVCKEMFLENCTRLCPHDWELNIFGAALSGLYFLNTALIHYRLHASNSIGLSDPTLVKRLRQESCIITGAQADADRSKLYLHSAWKTLLSDKDKKELDKFFWIIERRLRLFEKGRFFDWLTLMRHCLVYMRMRGPQGMIEDMVRAKSNKE